MKKIIVGLVLVALGCFAFQNNTYSQTNICFNLNITDGCSGEWPGYYAARVSVTFGGSDYCNTTIYDLSDGDNDELTYECSELPIEEKDPCYVINVTVCRQELDPTCCDSDSSLSLTYAQLESCLTPQLSVTLSE